MEALNKNILLAGEVIAERWKVVEKIGEGTFSQIYLAYSIHENQRVAVKVEAPSSLKPVLEWESSILKSLQDCNHVCRYFYHGKHAESTVLVMELLGESMSMLRVTPDAIHGVPLQRCVSVGLEMLECIQAFHQHGYVHRDIKASNFAMADAGSPAKGKYYIIDFGLSRQHLGEDKKVIPARPQAEFRGTSMYASLSSHRRQELGPKDDLWSWFYLVMDFMRGELPWATDAQQKNRQTVLNLKEYYTEKCPSLLVEGLVGASHLVAMMKYLQSLKYEDQPGYDFLRRKLKRVETGSKEEDTMELWNAIESERERALQWTMRAKDAVVKDSTPQSVLDTLLAVAKKFNTFFGVLDLTGEERVEVQEAVYRIEKKLRDLSHVLAPPPIQSFVKRRLSEQKLRSDALRRRRERDFQVRQSLELKARRQNTAPAALPTNDGKGPSGTPVKVDVKMIEYKSEDSAMEVSDGEETGTPSYAQKHGNLSGNGKPVPVQQPPAPPGPPPQRWNNSGSKPPFTSSPRPPLPPGPPQNGAYMSQPPPPLPPGYPPTGAGFVPPLPPAPPMPKGNGWPPAKPELERRSSGSNDQNGSGSRHQQVSGSSSRDQRDRDHDSSRKDKSRYERRSSSRDRKRRPSKRSYSRSSSRSRSRSKSHSRSRSSSRSRSPVHSGKRGRSRHRRTRSRSSSQSRSRSPRRRSSDSRYRSRSKGHHRSSGSRDDKHRGHSREHRRHDNSQQSSKPRDGSRRPSRWESK